LSQRVNPLYEKIESNDFCHFLFERLYHLKSFESLPLNKIAGKFEGFDLWAADEKAELCFQEVPVPYF